MTPQARYNREVRCDPLVRQIEAERQRIRRANPGTSPKIHLGDYVVATKYRDGDPGDQFCIGFYNGSYSHYGELRHLVVDNEGKNFRANGFRRVAKIGTKRGTWMVKHLYLIVRYMDRFSVWYWVRAPWKELHGIAADLSVDLI